MGNNQDEADFRSLVSVVQVWGMHDQWEPLAIDQIEPYLNELRVRGFKAQAPDDLTFEQAQEVLYHYKKFLESHPS